MGIKYKELRLQLFLSEITPLNSPVCYSLLLSYNIEVTLIPNSDSIFDVFIEDKFTRMILL